MNTSPSATEPQEGATSLRLKDDWDIPIQPPSAGTRQIGHFIGRNDELQRLVGELLRSPSRSILISGYRGVGKTSLVYRALNVILASSAADSSARTSSPATGTQEADSSTRPSAAAVVEETPIQFLYVLQNAAQLEAERPAQAIEPELNLAKIEPKQILVNLIRRLYTSSHDAASDVKLSSEVLGQIEDLYRKATASEVTITRYAERKLEAVLETEVRREVTFDLSGLTLRDSFIAGLGFTVVSQLVFAPSSSWGKLLTLVWVVVLPLLAVTVRLLQRQAIRKEDRNLASELYSFDSSIGNLEFDLEAIHRRLNSERVRAVYVIDELDKLDENDVAEVLKFFKNLFTLSSAVFIFVGGEELYRRFQEADPQEGVFRSKEYTYFTSKYFIARPASRDIDQFLSAIVANGDEVDAARFDLWKRAVVFEARGDYFDLIQRVKDRITGLDVISSSIDLREPTADDLLRAALQGAVTIVFDDSYRVSTPSRWVENDLLLRTMYEFAHGLLISTPGSEVADDSSDSTEAAAKRDLTSLLNRMGVLDVTAESGQEIRGLTVPIRTYRYTARASTALPEGLRARSEIEQRFLEEFRRFWSALLYFSNVLRLLGDHPATEVDSAGGREQEIVDELATAGFDSVPVSTFAQFWPAYQRMSATLPPYAESREQIEVWYESLVTANRTMRANAPLSFGNFLRAEIADSEVQVNTLSPDANLFGEELASLSESLAGTSHVVLVAPESGKRALVTAIPRSEVSARIGRAVRASRGKVRAVLLSDETGAKTPKPAANVSQIPLAVEDADASAAILKRLKVWFER